MTILSVLALVFIAIPAFYVVMTDGKARYVRHFPLVLGGSAVASLTMLMLNMVIV
jgi:hypothetical protein